jgi:hypothetical protein
MIWWKLTPEILSYTILQKNHTNTDEELLAAKRIFGLLPEKQAQGIHSHLGRI